MNKRGLVWATYFLTASFLITPLGTSAIFGAPKSRTYTIKSGTRLVISTANTLSTKTHKSGDTFVASLARPIVNNGWVIAKPGARVEGVIIKADPGGRVKGVASISVRLKRLTLVDGRVVSLRTTTYVKNAKTTKKKDALKIGIGTGVGAAIGAIAGGGKGAAIGAGVGGGAGTGYVLATHGDPAVIPSEASLTFRLTSSMTIVRR